MSKNYLRLSFISYSILVLIVANGCSVCDGRFRSTSLGYELMGCSSERCTEYEQAKANVEFVLAAASQAEVKMKLNHVQFINIDQEAATYSARMKQLCDFFINGHINFKEYSQESEKANQDYQKLRQLVLSFN